VVHVESLLKVSGGVVDVEPFVVSQNTLGNGKNRKLKISKEKCQMVVPECISGSGVSNTEVVVVVDDEVTIHK